MDLTSAVQIANLRSISKQDIQLYEHYIQRYLVGFKSLYKLTKVKPIHHAALHYGNTLRSFRPAHTHEAAFYEQYIHFMQTQNHNMKLSMWSIFYEIIERCHVPVAYYNVNKVALNRHSCIVLQERQSCKHCSLTIVKYMNVLLNLQKHTKPFLLRMSEERAWPIWLV